MAFGASEGSCNSGEEDLDTWVADCEVPRPVELGGGEGIPLGIAGQTRGGVAAVAHGDSPRHFRTRWSDCERTPPSRT